MDRIPDSRWDATLWMGYQIMDGVKDRGDMPGRVPIWPLLPFDSTGWHKTLMSHHDFTGWHKTLMSHQSEILHSLIFDYSRPVVARGRGRAERWASFLIDPSCDTSCLVLPRG